MRKGRGAFIVAASIVALSPSAAGQDNPGAGCDLAFVSPGPLVMVERGDSLVTRDVEIATSCRTGEVDVLTFGDDQVVIADVQRSGRRGLIRFDIERPLLSPGEDLAGDVVARVFEGPLVQLPLTTAERPELDMEALVDPLVVRFRSDDAKVSATLPVTLAGGSLRIRQLRARLYLDHGDIVPFDIRSTDGEREITDGEVMDLALSTASVSGLESAGGVLVVTQAATGQVLTTIDLDLRRRPSPTTGWLLVGLPAAMALLAGAIGIGTILVGRRARPRRRLRRVVALDAEIAALGESGTEAARRREELVAERTSLKTAHDADPRGRLLDIERTLQRDLPEGERALAEKERRLARAAAVRNDETTLPVRAEWSWTEGWAGSLTAFGAATTALLGATGVLDEFLPGLTALPFVTLNIFFAALVAGAPMAYNAIGRFQRGEHRGTLLGLFVASFASLWGIFGFLSVLLAMNTEVVDSDAQAFFTAMLLLAAIGVLVYAVQTMIGRAQLEPPSGPRTSRPVTVRLQTEVVVVNALNELRSSEKLDHATIDFLDSVIADIEEHGAPPGEIGEVEIEVPVHQVAGLGASDAGEGDRSVFSLF